MGNICYLNTKKQKKLNNWKKDQRMPFKAEAAKWVNKLNFRVWHSNTWNQVVSDRLHVYGSDKVKEWLSSSVSFKHSGHLPTWKQIVRECKYNGSVCTSDPRTRASNHFLNYAQHAAFHTIVCYCSLTASIHAAQATPASGRRLCQTYAMIYAEQSTVHARTGILFLWRIGILFCFLCEPQKYRMTTSQLSRSLCTRAKCCGSPETRAWRVLYCKMLTDINLEP